MHTRDFVHQSRERASSLNDLTGVERSVYNHKYDTDSHRLQGRTYSTELRGSAEVQQIRAYPA